METEVIQAAAHYTEEVLGKERFRYCSAVVANCKMLAAALEEQPNALKALDQDALIIAGYLHDISTAEYGLQEHHVKSAAMAAEFLQEIDVPAVCIERVKQAILVHTTPAPHEEQESVPLEGRILYDADKLGRLSGLAVVTSLIEFGARYPNRAVNGEMLTAILHHIEERFVELYQSLHTAPAKEIAREKFGHTLAFLDGVIEHLSEFTPV